VPKRMIMLVSVAVGIIALLAGLIAITQRNVEYSADASVIILPASTDPQVAAGLIDTLARNNVQATFAQAYTSDKLVRQAYGVAGFTPQEAAKVSLSTSVITDTSIVVITASSADARLAERAADAVANAKPDLRGFSLAFTPELVSAATGTAFKSGPSSSILFLVALLVAGGLGALTYAGLNRLARRGNLLEMVAGFGGGSMEAREERRHERDRRRERSQAATERRHAEARTAEEAASGTALAEPERAEDHVYLHDVGALAAEPTAPAAASLGDIIDVPEFETPERSTWRSAWSRPVSDDRLPEPEPVVEPEPELEPSEAERVVS